MGLVGEVRAGLEEDEETGEVGGEEGDEDKPEICLIDKDFKCVKDLWRKEGEEGEQGGEEGEEGGEGDEFSWELGREGSGREGREGTAV